VGADSKRVGFYRFDEGQVIDFYLQMNQTQVQDTLDIEAYPKPGAPNPIADVFVYDTTAGQATRMDVRNGQPLRMMRSDIMCTTCAGLPTAPSYS